MRVIETTIDVQEDGHALLRLPRGLKPGPRKVVIVLEEPAGTPSDLPQPPPPEAPSLLPQVPVTTWTGSGSTRREDLYGERGR